MELAGDPAEVPGLLQHAHHCILGFFRLPELSGLCGCGVSVELMVRKSLEAGIEENKACISISHFGSSEARSSFMATFPSRSGLSNLRSSPTESLRRANQFETMAHVSWCFFLFFEILSVSSLCVHSHSLF